MDKERYVGYILGERIEADSRRELRERAKELAVEYGMLLTLKDEQGCEVERFYPEAPQ